MLRNAPMCPALLVVDLASHGPAPAPLFPPRGGGASDVVPHAKARATAWARECASSHQEDYMFRKLIMALIAGAALSITAVGAVAPPPAAPPAAAPPPPIPPTASPLDTGLRRSRGGRGARRRGDVR